MKKVALLTVTVLLVRSAKAQAPPNVFDVLMNSAVSNITVTPPSPGAPFTLMNALPNIFTVTGTACGGTVTPGCFTTTTVAPTLNGQRNTAIAVADAVFSASMATALSTIPIASPGSGVIVKVDPTTGGELSATSTLGPIFTERAETIGRHKLYIAVSNQDFHFKTFNGRSLNNLALLDKNVVPTTFAAGLTSFPSTYNVGMDVRLSQEMAFFTYGVTNRFDVSVGLPEVHAAVQARTFNGLIYVGQGFAENGNNCWCADTFTPGAAPGTPQNPNGQGLALTNIGQTALGKTGFGDVLLRFKGSVYESSKTVVAVGTDLRLPTGDAQNYLGIGTTAVRPFLAVSFYSKQLPHGIVFSPHLNVGWQFSGKSVLGGLMASSEKTVTADGATINYYGSPFTTTKDYLPDVFSWAGGTEVALGKHNTVVVDILGNQIGWIHGIENMKWTSVTGGLAPVTAGSSPCGTPMTIEQAVPACGFVDVGRVAFGQYNGSFGYKVRVAGNLVATFNMLVRLDNNGFTARAVPFYSLSYTF